MLALGNSLLPFSFMYRTVQLTCDMGKRAVSAPVSCPRQGFLACLAVLTQAALPKGLAAAEQGAWEGTACREGDGSPSVLGNVLGDVICACR